MVSGYRQFINDATIGLKDKYKTLNMLADDLAYNMMHGNNPKRSPQILRGGIPKAAVKTSGIVSEVAPVVEKTALDKIMKYAPITGDIWDIYSGGRKIIDPSSTLWQRAIGLGQAGLGTLGLATLGAGSLAKSGVKAGIKGGIKSGAERFLNSNIGKVGNFVNNTKWGIIPTEVVSLLMGRAETKKPTKDGEDGGNNQQQQLQTQLQGGGGYYGGGYVPTGGQVSVGGITPEQVNQIGNMVNQNIPQQQDDARQLFYDYMIKQQAMQPYRDRLNDYINSYQRRSDQSYNQDKYLALLQGLTGAQGLGQLMGKYTSLGDEAKQIDLQRMQGEDLKNVGEGLDTLMGNVELARRLNLPLNSVNADKDFVKLAVTSDLNAERLQQRMAIEQAKINARFKLQQAQNTFRAAMKRGDRKGASQAQNQVKYWNAINRQIENGVDPEEAVQWGNRQFGTTFSTPPSGSGMGSKILPM